MGLRVEFERWISAPPYEKSVNRYHHESGSWPGQYLDISVQLAWEAFVEARDLLQYQIIAYWDGDTVEPETAFQFEKDSIYRIPVYATHQKGHKP